MKICNTTVRENRILQWKDGNLYKRQDDIYIAAFNNNLINLKTGNVFSQNKGFARYDFKDVTDKYCLTEK